MVLRGGVLGGGQGAEAGQVHALQGAPGFGYVTFCTLVAATVKLEHPTVMHVVHKDFEFGVNTGVALRLGRIPCNSRSRSQVNWLHSPHTRHQHPRETDNIYSCDLAANHI